MGSRTRRWVGVVLLVIAGLLLPVAVVATWAARTVTDTSAFVERVGPVASAPEVQTFLEEQAVDQVRTAVENEVAPQVSSSIDGLALPDPVKNLLRNAAASLGGAVDSTVRNIAERVVRAPEFQGAFDSALTSAHAELVSVLEGDSRAVVTQDGTVSIKLATVGNSVRAQLVDAGYSFVDRLPTLQASVPIASVEQLQAWQGYYAALKVLVWLGPLLVLLFLVLGAWLVRDLAVAGVWFAGTALLALVGVTVGVRAVVSSATSGLADPAAADAARAVVDTMTDTLTRNATVVGIVGIVLLAGCAFFAARRRLTPAEAA